MPAAFNLKDQLFTISEYNGGELAGNISLEDGGRKASKSRWQIGHGEPGDHRATIWKEENMPMVKDNKAFSVLTLKDQVVELEVHYANKLWQLRRLDSPAD